MPQELKAHGAVIRRGDAGGHMGDKERLCSRRGGRHDAGKLPPSTRPLPGGAREGGGAVRGRPRAPCEHAGEGEPDNAPDKMRAASQGGPPGLAPPPDLTPPPEKKKKSRYTHAHTQKYTHTHTRPSRVCGAEQDVAVRCKSAAVVPVRGDSPSRRGRAGPRAASAAQPASGTARCLSSLRRLPRTACISRRKSEFPMIT